MRNLDLGKEDMDTWTTQESDPERTDQRVRHPWVNSEEIFSESGRIRGVGRFRRGGPLAGRSQRAPREESTDG